MNQISSEVLNYFKLERLIGRSCISLRQLFKNRYALFNNGKVWEDTPQFGKNYLNNTIGKNKNINLTPVQKTYVADGNSNEWDVTTLTTLLLFTTRPRTLSTNQMQQLDHEDKLLRNLRDIRNKIAHQGTKSIDNVKFAQLWTDLAAILVDLGDVDTELDKLKDDSVFEQSKQTINEENVKEALRLNSLGTQAHKDGNYSEAVVHFTKATLLPAVLDRDRAVFFSNMASSRLALHEQPANDAFELELFDTKDERYRALQDAKQARHLWPTWWKGHYRIGQVYAALDEHQKATRSFERAFALDATRKEIQHALNESRIVLSRQPYQKYLDPETYTKPFPELLKEWQQKFGKDPESVRNYLSFIEKTDPVGADVIRGHQYELGDIGIEQDYEKAAEYFAKAANEGSAEGMYKLARLTDHGLGVQKDHAVALRLLEQAASQSPQHPVYAHLSNVGVAEAEHALGVRYFEGIAVRKDLSMAAYWYQRATDHGDALAANNLGSMYLNGFAFDRNLEKAEQLFELASRKGNSLAMQNLAELLLYKNNFQMAEIWYNRACEAGNIICQRDRDQFIKTVKARQQNSNRYSSNELECLRVIEHFYHLRERKYMPSVVLNRSYIDDYKVLKEHAKRGSVTAQRICDALEYFASALNIMLSFENLTQEQEEKFIHDLSQCYRIETIVAQIPAHMHKRISEVIDRALHRCSKELNSVPSQLDEDVRLCYATLNINSLELIDQFLVPCKQKYSKSIYFFLISGAVNGFLRRIEIGLYNINCGLEIEPENCELLYHRAVLLRHLAAKTDMNIDEAIKAYRTFLSIAPKDHRKVPEVYYEMAICYIIGYTPDVAITWIKKLYVEGQQAEKLQLPCFLPYQSDNLAQLLPFVDLERVQNIKPAPDNDLKKRLTDPHRVEVIRKHREWEGTTLNEKCKRVQTVMSTTLKPRVAQRTVKSLIGLKPITLRELDPTKDQVYNGYVLSVTIIEEAHSWNPSIHLVIQDEHFDCERMLIYNIPDEQGEYLIGKSYIIGSKIHIINPYLRIGAVDMKPTVRVDDLASIVMQSDSERILDMCRYCCQPKARHVCGKCHQARYCSKECQTMDWKLYQHKLICKNR